MASPIIVVRHDASLAHDTGVGHPERSERVGAVLAGVRRVPGVEERDAPAATHDDLTLVHSAGYVDAIERFCAEGGGHLDADTAAVPASWEAALRSAGAVLEAVDAVGEGGGDVAFAVCRPPGHHALPERAMGFCLFNNVAVAAERLRRDGRRVAIVDWDVHHGNGTQDMFLDADEVLYISTHAYPFYPGTGGSAEVGTGAGEGFTVNIPMPSGAGGGDVSAAFDRLVMPVVEGFEPDMILVSAGYDAHRADPLAGLAFESADYGWMAGQLADIGAPLVFALEGGYDLGALEASVEATLLGATGTPFEPSPRLVGGSMLETAVRQHEARWSGVG